jgi:hypothetical protein
LGQKYKFSTMDEDKSISNSSIPLFSKEWIREYRKSLFSLSALFIWFIYNGYQIISACLSHQSPNEVLQFFGFEVQCVGLVIGRLTDWVEKEHSERESAMNSVSSWMLLLGAFIFLLAAAVRFS